MALGAAAAPGYGHVRHDLRGRLHRERCSERLRKGCAVRWALRMLTVLQPIGPGTGSRTVTMGQFGQQFKQVGHQLVASNGAMSACEKSGQWQAGLIEPNCLERGWGVGNLFISFFFLKCFCLREGFTLRSP